MFRFALPLLLASLAVARAQDLSGRWALEGTETPFRQVEGELRLEPTGPGRWVAVRTVRRGASEVTLRGDGTQVGGELRVRFPTGQVGLLQGLLPHVARYRLAAGRLVGVVLAPGTGGRRALTREVGTRSGGVSPARRTPARLEGRLRVEGQRLVDPLGRGVLLRGVNAGLKRAPFLAPHTADDVRRLVEATGIDFVRLYFAWCAIEPRPLEYDQAYLDAAAAQVRMWSDAGVYVLVDLHQDLWGPPLAEHGAPAWASFGKDEEKPKLLPDEVPWQLRYVDPRCWRSFEAFWSDRPVLATGLGLQEHYARAWQQLAGRLAGIDRVVGYDPINEPFMGAEIQDGLRRVALGSSWTLVSSGIGAGFKALFTKQSLQEALTESLVKKLSRPDAFERTIGRLADANRRFERRLSAFHARMGRAIRQVDPGRPLFVEPMPLAGVGVPSEMPHPGIDQVVYAPHLYDAFMDSGLPFDGDLRRVERALARHVENARRLGVPLVVGEWGNLPDRDGERFGRAVGGMLERTLGGDAYWDHVPGREAEPLFLSTVRPYPARVAGELRELAFRPGDRMLTVRFAADPRIDAPTVIALPGAVYPAGVTVALQGDAASEVQGGLLLVWARAGEVRVEVRPAP